MALVAAPVSERVVSVSVEARLVEDAVTVLHPLAQHLATCSLMNNQINIFHWAIPSIVALSLSLSLRYANWMHHTFPQRPPTPHSPPIRLTFPMSRWKVDRRAEGESRRGEDGGKGLQGGGGGDTDSDTIERWPARWRGRLRRGTLSRIRADYVILLCCLGSILRLSKFLVSCFLFLVSFFLSLYYSFFFLLAGLFFFIWVVLR